MTGKSKGKEGIIPRIRVDMTSGYAIISLLRRTLYRKEQKEKKKRLPAISNSNRYASRRIIVTTKEKTLLYDNMYLSLSAL